MRRMSSSGSVNDTDAAECTMSVTRPASDVARGLVEPEVRLLDVAGDRVDAVLVRAAVAQDRGHRLAQALVGLRLVARAHERVHAPVRALEVAREDLHPEEPGGSRDEDAVAGRVGVFHERGHVSARSSSMDSSTDRARSCASGIASSSA